MVLASRKEIVKGTSGDLKYCGIKKDGEKVFIKVDPEGKQNNKRMEYKLVSILEKSDFPHCLPIEAGEDREGTYIIYSWIDGLDADRYMRGFPVPKLYAYGMKAGQALNRIHEKGIVHGDYALGNMIIGSDKQLYIVDFGSSHEGDGIEDFTSLVQLSEEVPLFAAGLVNGYFDSKVDEKFWEKLKKETGQEESWYPEPDMVIPSWYKGNSLFSYIKT